MWTEKGVALEPGIPPVVGKQAIQANMRKCTPVRRVSVLSYAPASRPRAAIPGSRYTLLRPHVDQSFRSCDSVTSSFLCQFFDSPKSAACLSLC